MTEMRLLRHASAFGERSIEQVKDGIELSLLKEEVPELIKHLTDNGVRLYEAKAVTKSLEDRFLEITEEREGTKLA